ncbi:MAG TPA: bacillithiol biosynthesis cysteine-adding enzyme BshC [Vicinamibacterales bacterium]|nr:bacillithiol biosynthesis cysteine-adding enzyme BshC [Vicinamibacterales bacterium]
MLSQPGVSTAHSRFPIDIRRFRWISRLAADYVHDYPRLREFFAGNPAEPAAWRERIARVQQHPRQRDRIADVLRAQQHRREAPPEARAAADRLRDPQTVAIVTGQQAGLLGGPLFTLLKALTALKLAERVRDREGVPAVAIFWVDAEDHDWDEVRHCGVLDANGSPCSIELGNPPGAHAGPVANVRLDASITDVLAQLESALPPTEFTADLLADVRRIYAPGAGMAEAFGTWLESVLGPKGLVVYDASDPAAKPLVSDLFVTELLNPARTTRLANEAGEQLQAAGYHAQVEALDGSVALFRLDGQRVAIEDPQAWAARARTSPEQFSPNVLLRPLVQDTLFPTVCYVAGPNELAYLAQLRGVYEAFGIPMPLLQQRATATLVDANAMRFLTRYDFPLESLRAQDEAALNELLESQLPPSVDAAVHAAMRVVDEHMAVVAREVTQVDTTLEGTAKSTLSRMQDDLKKLHGKIIQAAKRKDETLKRQFHHAQAQAFPNGHPQEREIGFISFLNKYGPALIDRLGDELPLDMGQHWVLSI